MAVRWYAIVSFFAGKVKPLAESSVTIQPGGGTPVRLSAHYVLFSGLLARTRVTRSP
jgi:hypothetical protein